MNPTTQSESDDLDNVTMMYIANARRRAAKP
jgi:hypothetical protein